MLKIEIKKLKDFQFIAELANCAVFVDTSSNEHHDVLFLIPAKVPYPAAYTCIVKPGGWKDQLSVPVIEARLEP